MRVLLCCSLRLLWAAVPEDEPLGQLLPETLPQAQPQEVEPEVREDITSSRINLVETLIGFFGESKKWVRVSKARGSKHGLLPYFCSDKDLWNEDTVVSCDCCTDHLVGDPRAVAALLYNSSKEQAPAFRRADDGTTRQVGTVNVWSVGGRIPAVLCDRGRLVCHCEDPVRGWAEFEPACRRGPLCEAPEEVEEGVSKGYEEHEAKVEEEEDQKEVSEAIEKKKAASALELGDAKHRCEFGGRVPLGHAFCEDFSVDQCELTYARTSAGLHHTCAVDQQTFRHCGAQLLSEERARERTEEAMAWAVQNFFTPELDWKVRTLNFTTTVVADEWPAAKLFQDEVRQRMEQLGTLVKLAE